MSKFAHMSDIHLGAHREPALRELERKCFAEAMDMCVREAVDFVLDLGRPIRRRASPTWASSTTRSGR